MAKAKITKQEAYRLAKKAGWEFDKDFHAQGGISAQADLAAIARLAGYRKPANANGSTARCFFGHLAKLRKKRGWK
jgi:hypothetical protein